MEQQNDLSILWETTIELGYHLQLTYKDLFPEARNKICFNKYCALQKLFSNENSSGQWKETVFKLPLTAMGVTKENQHFLFQLGDIPVVDEFCVQKLSQLAFNIGQLTYRIGIEDPIYTLEMISFYKKNQMDQLTTYVDPELLSKIQISDELIVQIKALF
jgi:hypothetical protein